MSGHTSDVLKLPSSHGKWLLLRKPFNLAELQSAFEGVLKG